MSDDLISREETLDVFAAGRELLRRALDDADVVGVERAKYEWGLGLIESYIADVKDLPAAQPQAKCIAKITLNEEQLRDAVEKAKCEILASQPQWIPCSERLPGYGVSVLTYDGHCFCVEKRIPTIRDDKGEPLTGDWWVSDDYDEYDSDYYPNLRDGACIAWMPLPEPYDGR